MLSHTYLPWVLFAYATAITLESVYSYKNKLNLYNLKDSMVSLLFGITGIVIRTASQFLWIAVWFWLYAFSPWKIPQTLWSWVLLFFANEFVYYWFHRISHEWRPLWAVHVNHHSSEYMNFTTATRTPLLNFIFHNIFWIPLPILGFHPTMIFTMEMVTFSLTFFQHTSLFRKNKWMDFIFNTPTHHRVHHASNPEYLDKNYGNILIIFDRIFGTFQEETIPPVYGLTKNVGSFNPVKVAFHEWVDIWRDFLNRKEKPFRLWKWNQIPVENYSNLHQSFDKQKLSSSG